MNQKTLYAITGAAIGYLVKKDIMYSVVGFGVGYALGSLSTSAVSKVGTVSDGYLLTPAGPVVTSVGKAGNNGTGSTGTLPLGEPVTDPFGKKSVPVPVQTETKTFVQPKPQYLTPKTGTITSTPKSPKDDPFDDYTIGSGKSMSGTGFVSMGPPKPRFLR